MLSSREKDIREILNKYIWGADSDTLEGTIGKLLRDKKLTIAIAETFTSGQLAGSFCGLKSLFKGGLVLPVKATANETSAIEMARQARRQFKADIGLAIDGRGNAGTRPKPNAFIAAVAAGKSAAAATGYPGNPQLIARRTINHALIFLRDFVQTGVN
jgi:nicotinamide-nucleotide amidase